jgi:hypothetical protein
MKTRNIQFMIAALFFFAIQVTAQAEEFTKKMNKSFDVNKNATLILKNKFGKIHCSNWDKNVIAIEVEIKVEASNQDKANRYFDRIKVEISGSNSQVSAITSFDDDLFKKNSNNEISIDFNVSMPASVNLEVDHKFGDLIVGVVSGSSEIELSYGSLDIRRLEGNSNILDIKFSEGKIAYVKNAELELQYSELDIDEAGSMNAESKFSEFQLGKVDVLTLDSGYDEDYIGFVRDLDLEAGFSDVEVRNLTERIVADLDYGELKVKEVDAGFSLIEVTTSFGDANLGIHPDASFKLVATIKMGDFSYPRDKARLSVVDLSYTSNKYEGVIGDDENPTSRVMIETKNGGANLYYR